MIVDTSPAVNPAVVSMVAGLRPCRLEVVMGSKASRSNYAVTRVGRSSQIQYHVEAAAILPRRMHGRDEGGNADASKYCSLLTASVVHSSMTKALLSERSCDSLLCLRVVVAYLMGALGRSFGISKHWEAVPAIAKFCHQ